MYLIEETKNGVTTKRKVSARKVSENYAKLQLDGLYSAMKLNPSSIKLLLLIIKDMNANNEYNLSKVRQANLEKELKLSSSSIRRVFQDLLDNNVLYKLSIRNYFVTPIIATKCSLVCKYTLLDRLDMLYQSKHNSKQISDTFEESEG